jgi:hypothetical protein
MRPVPSLWPWKRRSLPVTAAVLALVWAAAGCGKEKPPHGRAAPGEVPALISLDGGNVESGFATGTIRGQRALPAYWITKHPVTKGQYAACVQRGLCPPPDPSACDDAAYRSSGVYAMPDYRGGPAEAPAVCVGQHQAEAFCTFIGGRLPTLDEWLLAARGDTPRRYPWGDAPASCQQHPLFPQVLSGLRDRAIAQAAPAEETPSQCPAAAFDGSELAVGKHPSGAARSGIEDVLLTPGELLVSDPESPFNACGGASSHCVVFGLEPAAIDSVEPFFEVPDLAAGGQAKTRRMVPHAYAFRCVLEGKR